MNADQKQLNYAIINIYLANQIKQQRLKKQSTQSNDKLIMPILWLDQQLLPTQLQDQIIITIGYSPVTMQTKSQNYSPRVGPDTPRAERNGIPLVYSWGRNKDGELAINTSKFTVQPSPVRGFRGLALEIASARSHTAILNRDGEIFMAGSGQFGKIDIHSTNNNFRGFKIHQQMKNKNFVKKIATGDYHTLAITEDGVLYTWGGKLWDKVGHKGEGIVKIERLAGQHIVDVASGDFHTVALDSEGQVYAWGGGGSNKNKGQLGHSNKKDYPHPEPIVFFKGKKVKKVACGDYHTMILTQEEELYAFGQGNFGQLGTGGKEDTITPKKVILNFQQDLQQCNSFGFNQRIRIQQLALSGKHSLILTNKGQIYACGCGGQGQLGQGITENKYEPILIQSLLGKHIKMVAAGSNHSLCLTDRGDIFSCGYNAYGQVGVPIDKFVMHWMHVQEMQGKRVALVFAGGDHSWCVLDQNQPLIEEYELPSPIRIKIQQTDLPKFIEPPKRRQEQTPLGPSTNRELELVITAVQFSHKFIHFVFKDKLIKNSISQINAYIDTIRKIQGKNLKFSKMNQDGQIYNQHGQLTFAGNPKGMTIMLISELPQTADEHLSYNPKNQIAIGGLIMMDSNMLKVQGKIPSHNTWFFKFLAMFEHELQKVRFVELRPKIY